MKKYAVGFSFFIAFGLCLFGHTAFAAVTLQFSNNGICPSTNSCSYNSTIPSLGSNGYAVLYTLGYHNSGNLITSVSLGGHAMTKVNDQTIQNANQDEWDTWVLSNPPVGTQTITITGSGTITYILGYDTYFSSVSSLDATSSLASAFTNSGTACTHNPTGSVTYVCWDGGINTNLSNDAIIGGGRFDSGTPASSTIDYVVDTSNFGNNQATWQSAAQTGAAGSYAVELAADPATNYAGLSLLALHDATVPAPTLFWVSPTNGYVGGDFQAWNLGFTTIPQQAEIPYYIRIDYCTISISEQSCFSDNRGNLNHTVFNYAVPGNATGTIAQAKAQQLYNSSFGTSTPWQVNAVLINSAGQEVASTGNINIYITGNGTLPHTPGQIPGSLQIGTNASGTFAFSSTTGAFSSSSPWFVDCSGYQITQAYNFSFPVLGTTTVPFLAPDFIPATFCNAWKFTANGAGWLLSPPSWSTQDFQNAFNFSDVVPFNIVFGVGSVIQTPGNILTASSTFTSPNLRIKIPNLQGSTTGDILVVGTTTLQDDFTNPSCNVSCAAGLVTQFGNWMALIIWILVIVGVFLMWFH